MYDRKFFTSVGTCVLAYLSTVLGITAVSTTYWANFYTASPLPGTDRNDYMGHYGPWTICVEVGYRESCGVHFTLFRPSSWVFASGVFAAIAVALILEVCILAPLHLVMLCSKERILMSYKHAILAKLGFAAGGASTALLSALLFNLQRDYREESGYIARKAWSYYLQVVVVLLDGLLCMGCAFELYLVQQLGGDPTKYSRDPEGTSARTIVNPGYREDPSAKKHKNGGNGAMPSPSTRGRRPSSASTATAATTTATAASTVSSISSRSSRSTRRNSGSSPSHAGSRGIFSTPSGGSSSKSHAGHNHRRRGRSSSVSGSSRRRSSSRRRRRATSVSRTHSFSMSELGALPHQVGPDGQIISGSNLSLSNGIRRVPPPLTMLPLKSSLKKKKPAVSPGDDSASGNSPPSGMDVSDSSAPVNSSLSPSTGGGPNESVSSWSSDVVGLSIANPHFSPESVTGSPSLSTLTRFGSMKKVRIQTRSTDV